MTGETLMTVSCAGIAPNRAAWMSLTMASVTRIGALRPGMVRPSEAEMVCMISSSVSSPL